MQLRHYQTRSIEMLWDWMSKNNGHPCCVLPTGAGKSVIIASVIKDACSAWPNTRVLMVCHQKELIEQNLEKLRMIWPNAPVGVYSASIGKKQLNEPITYAGIQSIRGKSKLIGHIDLFICDECHMISHKEEGGYRNLINELLEINPAMRIVGYSATPYRLGHGLITDKPAIFDDLIEPVTIEELIYHKYLAPLRSKITSTKLSTAGVHKRGGEYIESELQKAVDIEEKNIAIVDEVISLAEDRKAWLFFCAGIEHSRHIAEALRFRGIIAEVITGETPKAQRESILSDFKAGKIKALTNANVLTTGFDYPDIDLIAMLRPTMSPGLYVQMAGRGLRPKSHTDHCLVLDFAGAVQTHGPITGVKAPEKTGDGNGEMPVKVCDNCHELCALSVRQCPVCGTDFPEPEAKKLQLHNDDIMGLQGHDMPVSGWHWSKHVSRTSGKEMCKITYYGDLSDPPINEYLTITHEGYAGQKAMQKLIDMADKAKAFIAGVCDIEQLCTIMNESLYPKSIEYRKVGKFYEVMNREW